MPYCTQEDIVEQLPLVDLIGLTDDDGIGVVDTSVVDRAIADGETEIDAYCQGRYTVPFDPVPAVVRRLCVDLAINNLFARRGIDPPEVRKDKLRNAIRFMEKVASGQIALGATTPAQLVSGNSSEASTPGDRIFTRDTLENY